ncbi:MAG: RNA recognition motif domain-containing protein [Thermoanaerobaculaceae bacterium]
MPAKVFIGNLSFRTTREELNVLVSAAGTVVDLYMPTDRATGKPRGFAFVEFASEAEAAEAIRQLNGKEVGGRALKVNLAEDRPRERSGPPRERPAGPRPFAPAFDPGPSFFQVEGRFSKPKGSRRGARGKKRSL